MKLSRLQQYYYDEFQGWKEYNKNTSFKFKATVGKNKIIAPVQYPSVSKLTKKLVLQNNSPITFMKNRSTKKVLKVHHNKEYASYEINIQGQACIIQTERNGVYLILNNLYHHKRKNMVPNTLPVLYLENNELYQHHPNSRAKIIHEASPSKIQYENVSEEQQFQYLCTIEYYELIKEMYEINKALNEQFSTGTFTPLSVRTVLDNYYNNKSGQN